MKRVRKIVTVYEHKGKLWLKYDREFYVFGSITMPLNTAYDYACGLVKHPSDFNAYPKDLLVVLREGFKYLGKMEVLV